MSLIHCVYELHWFQRGRTEALSQTSFDQDEAHRLFSNLAGRLDVDTARLYYTENGVSELIRSF
jgi:hypothetical protein